MIDSIYLMPVPYDDSTETALQYIRDTERSIAEAFNQDKIIPEGYRLVQIEPEISVEAKAFIDQWRELIDNEKQRYKRPYLDQPGEFYYDDHWMDDARIKYATKQMIALINLYSKPRFNLEKIT